MPSAVECQHLLAAFVGAGLLAEKLKPFLPPYIRDSTQLLDQLKALGALPPGAKVFIAAANSMYTNIDTDHAIYVIGKWLDSLGGRLLPPNFPLAAVKEAMILGMRNNLFEYGEMYFSVPQWVLQQPVCGPPSTSQSMELYLSFQITIRTY